MSMLPSRGHLAQRQIRSPDATHDIAPDERWRCGVCGHTFGSAAFDAHRAAFPPLHPLRRCLDAMEMSALGYMRHADGSWAVTRSTERSASQAQRLPTVRQELQHWDDTGESSTHERLAAPRSRTKQSGLVQAVAAARRRQKDRLRKRRQRAGNVPPQTAPLCPPHGVGQTPSQATDSKARKKRRWREPRSRERSTSV